jgi:hypothetical protein
MIYFDAFTCKNLQKIRSENLLSRLTLTDPRSKVLQSLEPVAYRRTAVRNVNMKTYPYEDPRYDDYAKEWMTLYESWNDLLSIGGR